MHKILKLQHHRHSGKLLPHHHTSYRSLGLLLLVVGAFLVFVQHGASADSLYVRTKVPAEIPTAPATVTNIINPYISATDVVELSGICPVATPLNIVLVTEGKTVLGSTPCTLTGTFAVTIPLRLGTQNVITQIFNITDDPGPLSQAISITYKPNSPVPEPNQPTGPTQAQPTQPGTPPIRPNAEPLEIVSNRSFYTFGPNSPVSWEGQFRGGTLPYTVHIDWGDATRTTYSVLNESQQVFTHRYGSLDGYIITVSVEDATGLRISQSYAAITPYVPRDQTSITPNGMQFTLPGGDGKAIALGIYTAYLLAITTVALLWFDARLLRPAPRTPLRVPVRPSKSTRTRSNRSSPSQYSKVTVKKSRRTKP